MSSRRPTTRSKNKRLRPDDNAEAAASELYRYIYVCLWIFLHSVAKFTPTKQCLGKLFTPRFSCLSLSVEEN